MLGNSVFKKILIVMGVITLLSTPVSAAPTSEDGASGSTGPCSAMILNFPAWYNGLQCDGSQPTITELNDVWIIVLNIVNMLLAATVWATLIFIIWGGFKYIKSRGDPGNVSEAKMAITHAIAGMGIAIGASAIVYYIQGLIK